MTGRRKSLKDSGALAVGVLLLPNLYATSIAKIMLTLVRWARVFSGTGIYGHTPKEITSGVSE